MGSKHCTLTFNVKIGNFAGYSGRMDARRSQQAYGPMMRCNAAESSIADVH
jgi:hypothetical protein